MKYGSSLHGKNVYVVDGCRTPFLKAKTPGAFSSADLAVATGKSLLNKLPINPSTIDEVILGSAISPPNESNIARIVASRLGCGVTVPGFTVMRNCASGMQAIDSGAMQIASGRSHLILVGGVDAMSHAPLLLNQHLTSWISSWYTKKTIRDKFIAATRLRPYFFVPVVGLIQGLIDPLIGLNMGQTAEELAYEFKISRTQMDEFSVTSHRRLTDAYAAGRMEDVIPIIDQKGKLYIRDDGLREDISIEQLSKLKPCFDKKFGKITAANSSQITDGACLLLLASAHAIKKYNLPVMGRIVDSEWAAIKPIQMGLGPVHAAIPILLRHELKPSDFNFWEINEAFAAQVLACLKAFNSQEYCAINFDLPEPMGAPSQAILNVDGGAIALGHPIGASGARIVLHILKLLQQSVGGRGMASICIGGGQGGAMYLESRAEIVE